MSEPASPSQRARLYLERRGLADAPSEAVAADASTRLFLRVKPAPHSYVLLAEVDPESDALRRYVGVARFLCAQGLPAPEVIDVDEDLGVALSEDLGTATLRAALDHADPAGRLSLFTSAVQLIVRIQEAGSRLGPDCPAYHIRFDLAVWMRELHFFREHFLEGHLGLEHLPAGLEQSFAALAQALVAEPQVLTHRDYHIDNLLVRRSGFALVDFQDARWGPLGYDLASLLNDRDVHRFLALAQREALVDWFARERGLDPGALRRSYALAGLQRSLKAVGTFAYQARHRGRNHYLEFILPSLRRAARLLPKDEAFTPIAELLQEIATPASSNFLY